MPRQFQVPPFYRSQRISTLKQRRNQVDPKRRDQSPATLDFGPVRFRIARHFGFCYGVENAIEIAYRAVEESKGRRVFLLSEMIHNPEVNADLERHDVRFLMDTKGNRLIDFKSLTKDDIVIVPAFGTTVELQKELSALGVDPYYYDTTCPFVEKVWKRSADLGGTGHTVVIHGKRTHEETRATFSHSKENAPTLIVRDMEDTNFLTDYILGKRSTAEFDAKFSQAFSANFDPERDLKRVGVVNQTTMLASETAAIAQAIRQAMIEKYGAENEQDHVADTRDTLCYATYENQTATKNLIEAGADLGLVVGGYNSSNTSHLVELCAERFPTFSIRNSTEIVDRNSIRHFDLHLHKQVSTSGWIPDGKSQLTIAVTSGASCPDAVVDTVILRVVELFPSARNFDEVFSEVLSSFGQPA